MTIFSDVVKLKKAKNGHFLVYLVKNLHLHGGQKSKFTVGDVS